MICPKCGSYVEDNVKYCPNCGAEQQSTVSLNKDTQQNNQNSQNNYTNSYNQQQKTNNNSNSSTYNNYNSGNNNGGYNQGYNQNQNGYNGYQQNIYNTNGYSYPSGKATTALALGIISLFCFGFIFGPISIVYGKNYLDAVKAGQADPTNSGKAQAGFVIGIIGTVLWAIGVIASIVGNSQ